MLAYFDGWTYTVYYGKAYASRPLCDYCGPFRGKYLRVHHHDQFGAVYICKGCDEE